MDERHRASWAERVLVERLSGGDETALVDLYDRYAGFVYGLAVRTLVDRQAAEDVTQEVFVSLWEHPERIESGRGTLRGFLGTFTHRRAVDAVRREEARRRREARVARGEAMCPTSPRRCSGRTPVRDGRTRDRDLPGHRRPTGAGVRGVHRGAAPVAVVGTGGVHHHHAGVRVPRRRGVGLRDARTGRDGLPGVDLLDRDRPAGADRAAARESHGDPNTLESVRTFAPEARRPGREAHDVPHQGAAFFRANSGWNCGSRSSRSGSSGRT